MKAAALALSISVLGLAWLLGHGVGGLIYLVVYAVAAVPGLPIGFALFGRRHGAGWVAGLVVGYALTAFAVRLPVQLGLSGSGAGALAWLPLAAATLPLLRVREPQIVLPAWRCGDTRALLLVLLVVPALAGPPFLRVGERDPAGNARYRAYFTADFLWHVALTSELTTGSSPPRNPYLARRRLHYYWTYFNVPAALAAMGGVVPTIEAHLLLNALGAGLGFVAMIYVFAWCVVPRAGPAATAVAVGVLAASAEGAYALWDLAWRGRPLAGVRELNIDAVTYWFLRSVTIDSLPRSLWYTPQHAAACALALVALVVIGRAGPRPSTSPAMLAGVSLGLALVFSPFLGGVFSLIYGMAAACEAVRAGSTGIRRVAVAAAAALPVLIALAWCAISGTFEGAGGVVAIGLSRAAAAAPLRMPILALGPVLVLALAGLAVVRRTDWPWIVPAVALAAGLFLLYFVTLTKEPIWIGWRAGQVLLVTMPALAAALFAYLVDAGRRWIAAASVAVACLAGVPTTIIDTWNAQDIANDAMGPGFRWTVAVPPDTLAATAWIRENTARDAIVQMSVGPRGRETWTLVPTFATRRMAAGRPISLLNDPEYDALSDRADEIFTSANAAQAAQRAQSLRVDYIYIDAVERAAFGPDVAAKFDDPVYFTPVFRQGSAAVYAVR